MSAFITLRQWRINPWRCQATATETTIRKPLRNVLALFACLLIFLAEYLAFII
jgi:hypothetical protein